MYIEYLNQRKDSDWLVDILWFNQKMKDFTSEGQLLLVWYHP